MGLTFCRAVSATSGISVAIAALACGPSFQAIYEGNARFEHCYALEERPQIPLNEKADCWQDWSRRYTYGQTRDRIHYATARYVALSQSLPTDEAMMMAAPGMTPRTSTITAPVPTNAFAPPPKVLEQGDVARVTPLRLSELPVIVTLDPSPPAQSDGGAGDASSMRLPSADCVEACATKFRACRGAACDANYRACMRNCVK